MDKTKICLSFWSRNGRANRIRRAEKQKKKNKRREEKKEEGMIKKSKGMDFCMEKSNHKPIFFVLMNLGLKEPYLAYLWCLAVLD